MLSEIRRSRITLARTAIKMHWRHLKRKPICRERWKGNTVVSWRRSGPRSYGCRRR